MFVIIIIIILNLDIYQAIISRQNRNLLFVKLVVTILSAKKVVLSCLYSWPKLSPLIQFYHPSPPMIGPVHFYIISTLWEHYTSHCHIMPKSDRKLCYHPCLLCYYLTLGLWEPSATINQASKWVPDTSLSCFRLNGALWERKGMIMNRF